MILSIPWLIVAIILYNMIAFSSSWPAPGTPGTNIFNDPLVSFDLISGSTWALTVGDLVTIVALVLLFVELIKATRTGGSSIVDHAFSMILFMICLIEFLVVRQAATSEFFFILIVTLIDVIAGFSITIRGARRDFGFGGAGGD
jgi:hypothetical protein